MLSRRILRLQPTSRLVFTRAPVTSVRFYNPDQREDTMDQSHQSGHAAINPKKATPADAANPEGGKQAPRGDLTGNKEGVGFADQVGSQSSSGSNARGSHIGKPESAEGVRGEENITPPSFAGAVKNKLGFKTTAGEDKQNRGGGKGVTGTGQVTADRGKRTMHTSAVAYMPSKTKGQAPEESRKPKDRTSGEQNAHLKHKPSAHSPDKGKGNAANDPKLPSHEVGGASASSKPQKRAFHSSAWMLREGRKDEHTADSYFKDIDETEPVNSKVHQVDSSSDTVARANEQPKTGQFSRSGPGSREYESTSQHDKPYDLPPTEGAEAEQKLRYGGQPGLNEPEPDKTAGSR